MSGRVGSLPREVGERLVGIGHAVRVFAACVGGAFFLETGQELVGQFEVHRTALFVTNRHQDPTDRETLLPRFVDLHRDLVARTTDPFATDFDVGFDVLKGRFENFKSGFLAFVTPADFFECTIEHALGGRFFAVEHQAVDELAGQQRLMTRVAFELRATGSDSSHESTSFEGVVV